MKKHSFILAMLLLPFMAGAQIMSDNFQLGFTVSPNLGWLTIDNNDLAGAASVSSDGSRAGVTYGILADLGFARNYYFSTAFTITSINGKLSESGAAGTGVGISSQTYKIRYIDIPLTLKLKSAPSQMGRFYGQFGLGTGIKIGAKADIKQRDASNVMNERENVNISSDINAIRLSLIAGAGAEWEVSGNLNVFTGVTYNNGFTKVRSGNPEVRNSYFALNLGVFF